jgi:hypothetical protein
VSREADAASEAASEAASGDASAALAASASALAAAALQHVQDPATRGVRVEDYLAVLGSMTGEAALLAAGVIDVETSGIPPGAPIFGDPINQVLTGDTANLASVPAGSVVGILVAELVPATYALADIPSLKGLYAGVAKGVGSVEWGRAPMDLPPDNRPSVLPIQVAFELRPAVDAAVAQLGLEPGRRHIPPALALAEGLKQVQGAIDPAIAIRLAFQVVFGMAKMAPMSKRAFEAAAQVGGGATVS